MRGILWGCICSFVCSVVSLVNVARAQTTINGSAMALRSTTTAISGSDLTLNQDGYVGTYVTLAAPGSVILTVNASGATADSIAPNLDISVNDSTTRYAVASGFNNYSTTVNLPAGTSFIRTDFNNQQFVNNGTATSNRNVTIRSLQITDNSPLHNNVTVQNQNTDALALTAANNYIANYRRGDATVALPGLAPGTQVQVDMKKLAFDFGAAIGQSDLTTNTALQNFVNKNFNMLVPANAGKWSSEEFIQGRPSTNQSNAILNYAAAHGMGARQHNLIWSAQPLSNAQQPNFAVNLLNTAVGTDPTAAAAASTTLRTDISSRINYYVDPARGRYSQVDVYNESFFNGAIIPFSTTYWRVYGASGIAGIYNEMNQKLAAAGQNARTYVNDYNILQNGYDNYGNFYAQHIETIENGDNNPSNGTVGGIGIQYYVLSGHSTARIQQVMQNLSALNLPISLTEFGVQNSVAADSATAQGMLTDSMRMMFGNPNATSFLIWGWSSNATSNLQSSSVLVDGTYLTLTNCGKDWEDLLGIQDFDGDVNDGWSTHLTATVEADGTINFNGYYGDYALTINNQPYDLNLLKGTTQYLVQVPEPATVVLAGISLLTVIMAWWMRKTGAL